MKATIKTQGQQFTVSEGDILIVNRYPGTEKGSTVEIKDVLAAGEGESYKVGKPTLSGATVSATITTSVTTISTAVATFTRRAVTLRTSHRDR